jgi:hypothetical protein
VLLLTGGIGPSNFQILLYFYEHGPWANPSFARVKARRLTASAK